MCFTLAFQLKPTFLSQVQATDVLQFWFAVVVSSGAVYPDQSRSPSEAATSSLGSGYESSLMSLNTQAFGPKSAPPSNTGKVTLCATPEPPVAMSLG